MDSHPRDGKRNGAFCQTICPSISPYILTNYTDDQESLTTLAHEFGHGVHALFARDKPHAVQHSSLPLAETASTLSEMVLFDKLLAEAESDDVRKGMLIDKMNGSYATVGRQAYFSH